MEPADILLPIDSLWDSPNERAWHRALDHYWGAVSSKRRALEDELNALTPAVIAAMNSAEWYSFLRDKYLDWKHTDRRRYARTTSLLEEHVEMHGLEHLDSIRRQILASTGAPLHRRLAAAMRVRGLGTAGASGLLALLYPDEFGTVDRFVVLALRKIRMLPEREMVMCMTEDDLRESDAMLLLLIFRRKANELNDLFGCSEWTPRKIDMVLWAVGRG